MAQDPHKAGYKFHVIPDYWDGVHAVIAYHPEATASKADTEGKELYRNLPPHIRDHVVGHAVIQHKPFTAALGKDFQHKAHSLFVDPAHRRSGVAAGMYDKYKEHTGHDVLPSPWQSDDARALWKDRLKESVLVEAAHVPTESESNVEHHFMRAVRQGKLVTPHNVHNGLRGWFGPSGDFYTTKNNAGLGEDGHGPLSDEHDDMAAMAFGKGKLPTSPTHHALNGGMIRAAFEAGDAYIHLHKKATNAQISQVHRHARNAETAFVVGRNEDEIGTHKNTGNVGTYLDGIRRSMSHGKLDESFLTEEVDHDKFVEAMTKTKHSPAPFPRARDWREGMQHGWLTTKGVYIPVQDHKAATPKISKHLFGKNLDRNREGVYNAFDNFKRETGAVKVTGSGDSLAVESHSGLTPHQHRVLKAAVHQQGWNKFEHRTEDDEASHTSQYPKLDYALGLGRSTGFRRSR